jgi:hypothetical protein
MTAEIHAQLRMLVSQAAVLKEQAIAHVAQIEAFERQARALGQTVALNQQEPKEEPKRRTYGPQKVG